MNYNSVVLGGRLTNDPQLSYLPSQMSVCDFNIAVNDIWRDKEGNKKEDVMFIGCRCFGKLADNINKYFKKGDTIFVSGKIKFEQWEKDGQKHSKHRVIVNGFQFIGGNKADNKQAEPQDETEQPPAKTTNDSDLRS